MRKMYSQIAQNIPDSGIKDFFDVANTMKGAISLGVGEPDFLTPEHIRKIAVTTLEKGATKYTANQGIVELRKAIAGYLTERFSLQYDPLKQVIVTVGASEGIDLALRVMVDPGDEVLVVEPSYVSYIPCIMLCGGVPVVLSTKVENEFKVTPEDLLQHITDKTKVLILPYPSNPTGAIMEKEDLEKIASIVKERDLFVISDEIYAELTYGKNHCSIASLPGMAERTIVLNGFSKAFAMTGWRLGYAAGPEEIIYYMNKVHQFSIMSAPTVSQTAAIDALTYSKRDEEIALMRAAYNERRKLLLQGFRHMSLSCFEPMGAFYVFPSIEKTGLSSIDFCNALLKEQAVAVIPGNAFGACGEGYIRCSYAYSIDAIKLCLERIGKFMEKYQ